MRSVRIPLTQGQFAIIDREDLEKVRKYKWHANKICGRYYACTDGRGYLYLHRIVVGAKRSERTRIIGENKLDCRKINIIKWTRKEDNRKPYTRRKFRKDKYSKIKTKYGVKIRIPLTQGVFAIIDPSDLPIVSMYSWQVKGAPGNQYACTTIKSTGGKRRSEDIRMHNLLMGPKENERVDHRNHNPFDNTRRNMRTCSSVQNHQNRSKNKSSPYRFKGIRFRKNGWESCIEFNGKYKYIGRFKSDVEAARAYDEAAKKYHGEFACLNFPVNK